MKIFFIIAVLFIFLSGCLDPSPTLTNNPDANKNIDGGKYIATYDGVDLYQYRIESINATCIGGRYYSYGFSSERIFDCEYDK
jgi:hypothetical protein